MFINNQFVVITFFS